MFLAAAAVRVRSTTSCDDPVDRDRLGRGQRLGALQPGQLQQLLDQPGQALRLVVDALGERGRDGLRVVGSASSSVSASSCSAPTGVFSSWLTLATKSRRTRATRCASVTSEASTATCPAGYSAPVSGITRTRTPSGSPAAAGAAARGAGRARPRGGRRCGGPGRPGYGSRRAPAAARRLRRGPAPARPRPG